MSMHHFRALLTRATKLQITIDRERQTAQPDWLRLLRLQKVRLALKKQLYQLADRHRKSRGLTTGRGGDALVRLPVAASTNR